MKKVKRLKPIEPKKPEEFFMAEEVLVEEWSDCEIAIESSWPAGTKIRMGVSGWDSDVYLKVVAPERPYLNPRYADEMKAYEKEMAKYEKKLARWEAEQAIEAAASKAKRIAKLKAELEELEGDNSKLWLVRVSSGFDIWKTAERLIAAGAEVVNVLSLVGCIVIKAEDSSNYVWIEGVESIHVNQKVSHCKVG